MSLESLSSQTKQIKDKIKYLLDHSLKFFQYPLNEGIVDGLIALVYNPIKKRIEKIPFSIPDSSIKKWKANEELTSPMGEIFRVHENKLYEFIGELPFTTTNIITEFSSEKWEKVISVDENQNTTADAWPIGGMNVRAFATNYPILEQTLTAPVENKPLVVADGTWPRKDAVVANLSGGIEVLTGTPGEIVAEPYVDPDLYYLIRYLLIPANATEPVDPDDSTPNQTDLTLFTEVGTEASGESDVTFNDGSLSISTNGALDGEKSIRGLNVPRTGKISKFSFAAAKPFANFTALNFNFQNDAAISTQYIIIRIYNGNSVVGNHNIWHGRNGYDRNVTTSQNINVPKADLDTYGTEFTHWEIRPRSYSSLVTGLNYRIDNVKLIDGFSSNPNNPPSNHTHRDLSLLESITSALVTTWNTAYNWVNTNGTNLLNHLTNFANPHGVTKSQVGLGSVDNTADADKEVSGPQQTALDLKLDASAYNERFKGVHLTLAALQTAHPTANAGDYAQVNEVGATDVVNYSWDDEENIWVNNGTGGSGATNTDQLPEGSTNLYHTTARVLATVLNGLSLVTGGTILATDSILVAFGKLQNQIDAISQLTANSVGLAELKDELKKRVDMAGSNVIDWSAGDTFIKVLTAPTTISDTNLPQGTDTKEISIHVSGDQPLTVPSYWVWKGGIYVGTKSNQIVVELINGNVGSEFATYTIIPDA